MILRTATGDEDRAAAMAIRRAVFVEEQEIPPVEEFDARDAEAEHLLVLEDDGTPVATCRVFADDGAGDGTARLGRLAVLPSARRRGLASRMIAACEERARTDGATRMVLDAQVTAMPLYERSGYAAVGEDFDDGSGILHRTMVKALV
ncbi:MAG TPA: GNAT family N-acetyltransferase [Baekduia sp.]|uniref:GNAT family N-acetyltransferase n=1 Tax=Baekduia sp. TaxID=2600305 RepID=UPI002D786525|nr:GNAT family N-acetyltransferase [Baekduia sp.]HET6508720.1 GNAT family N-acetyltransferase [Baekduia sp.]